MSVLAENLRVLGPLKTWRCLLLLVFESQDIRTTRPAFLEGQGHLLPTFNLRFYSILASVIYIPSILSVACIFVQSSIWFNFRPCSAFWLLPLLLLVRLLLHRLLLLLQILPKGWYHYSILSSQDIRQGTKNISPISTSSLYRKRLLTW